MAMTYSFVEGFAELSNLDFAPEMTFWAGKRYSSSNTSSHQFDWEYIQYKRHRRRLR